jgi:hypothetical protein
MDSRRGKHVRNLAAGERVIFGPYFLIRFGFAVVVLLLEIGLVSASRGVVATTLTAPVGLAQLTTANTSFPIVTVL